MLNVLIGAIVIGSVFALLGVAIENWLVKAGIVRNNTVGVIVIAFFCVLIKQTMFPDFTWIVWSLVILFSVTVGVHRGDVWYTMERGKWWWKS